MTHDSANKTPLVEVKVVEEPDKDWWEGYIPFNDCLKQVSFIASIGTGFTLSASVGLACSASFQSRTDNTTLALLTSTSQIFAWGGSTYAVALFAAIIGLLMAEFKAVVVVLQAKSLHAEAPDAKVSHVTISQATASPVTVSQAKGSKQKTRWNKFQVFTFGAYVVLTTVSLGFVVAGTALTGVGLNILAGGSGTMLQWSLLVIALPMGTLGLLVFFYANNMLPCTRCKPSEEITKRMTN